MTLGIAQLIAIFVVLAAVLALLNLFSSLSWFRKASLVVLTSVSYLVLYFAFPPLLGWPSDDPLPKRFNLVALYAQEPDRITGAKGNIYFWTIDKSAGTQLPRAYRIDFEPELHARVRDVRAKLNKNVPQVGETVAVDDADMTRTGTPNEDRMGTKSHKNTVKFFDAAPQAPPSKTDMPVSTMDDAEVSARAPAPVPAP